MIKLLQLNLILNISFYFNFLFSISNSYFHKKMRSERINCGHCLTVLVLKNDAHAVPQFL